MSVKLKKKDTVGLLAAHGSVSFSGKVERVVSGPAADDDSQGAERQKLDGKPTFSAYVEKYGEDASKLRVAFD